MDLVKLILMDLFWMPTAPLKVKALAEFVVLKKVNTHFLLQLRRSYKALGLICACCEIMMRNWLTISFII